LKWRFFCIFFANLNFWWNFFYSGGEIVNFFLNIIFESQNSEKNFHQNFFKLRRLKIFASLAKWCYVFNKIMEILKNLGKRRGFWSQKILKKFLPSK
jgi:hypothetical protein